MGIKYTVFFLINLIFGILHNFEGKFLVYLVQVFVYIGIPPPPGLP